MNRTCILLTAVLVASSAIPSNARSAFADPASPSPAQQLAQLNQQLDSDEAKLNDLNDQVERAQADVDRLNRQITAERQREEELSKRLGSLARLEYEQPALRLTTLIQARSLNQLLGELAQARLVVHKQGSLLDQARQLRRLDEQSRSQMSVKLGLVQAARDEAAQVAARTLALRNAALDAVVRARAAALAAQAQATQAASRVSITAPTGPWPNHFSYGYCTWYVATKRFVPWFGNAIEWWPNARAYGFSEGQAAQVGAIMVTRESWFGHVAYVEAVNGDGSWTVSEMNFSGWAVVDRRTIKPGQVPLVGFIYR
ncbi:MAG TPA: CHAP domain-containing protein [Candidatus Dormibacteraeota bacterium]|nr:CHAP domain-containing protein [Candidatus Dormibacteraeota bacterium]